MVVKRMLFIVATLAAAAPSRAQDIRIPADVDLVWMGSAGAAAGEWLDQGDLGAGDDRKDLIIGAPGVSNRGAIYVVFGGPTHSGRLPLATEADVTLTGAVDGARFGAATSAGYVLNSPSASPSAQRDLIVGAPGADASSAGLVYVFAGPLARGTHTAASAVLVIQGQPGERLGSSVATADLNGDGFREVIAGAPGTDRVYVFNLRNRTVGAGVAIASTAADMTIVAGPEISGTGVGDVLGGIDITGDGVQELIIGVPRADAAAGRVYIVYGHPASENWAFPGTISLAAASTVEFRGTNAGDQAGASLAFPDFVSDDHPSRLHDLVIGAPGSDGPNGSRADAGAAYLVWGGTIDRGCGGVAHCVRSLPTADVMFHGAVTGSRTGSRLASGDINRDAPNDLVFVADGPVGSELQVVYGRRLRTTIGNLVDLALIGKIDRRIISPTPISASLVYEVTGEGARDIIVGSAVADSGQGTVSVAISPKLQVTSRTLEFDAVTCASVDQAINVRNPSVIPLPWSATTSTSWIRFIPSQGSSVDRAAVSFRVVASAAGLAPGSYSGAVTLNSESEHVDMFVRISVMLTVTSGGPAAGTASTDFNGDGCADLALFRSGVWRIPGVPDRSLGTIGDIPVAGDYDGDRIADAAVFRPSDGTWHLADGQVKFGQTGDIPVPADYDGDGRLDLAVYRPTTATWLFQTGASVAFGQVGDLPVPGDYDGDGSADVAVFSRATGTWNIRNVGQFQLGGPGRVPVPADYDGDGRTDIAVYARPTGTWSVLGQFTVAWGKPSDIPVPLDTDRNGRAELVTYRRATGEWLSYDPVTGMTSTTVAGTPGDIPTARPAATRVFTTGLDFDRDGRSDIAVWRPSTGVWYLKKSVADYTQWSGVRWGDSSLGDRPVAADYDGDGVADVAVWRESTGTWFVLTSSSNFNQWFMARWGASGDRPVPGDFDGDGKADIAVWRPSDGVWYIKESTTSYATWFSARWGAGSLDDVPVPGDYDGDGKMDLAVWRPGTGAWYVKTSSSGYASFFTVQWGDGSLADTPIAADFDGDGRADTAVWRPDSGMWYIKKSSTSYATWFSARWGARSLNDVPVVADFDGDGQTDITVWRPSSGVWYVLASASNYQSHFDVRWGADALGDKPLGAASR